MMNDEEQQKLTVMLIEMSGKIEILLDKQEELALNICLLYTSPSPRDRQKSRMPSSA